MSGKQGRRTFAFSNPSIGPPTPHPKASNHDIFAKGKGSVPSSSKGGKGKSSASEPVSLNEASTDSCQMVPDNRPFAVARRIIARMMTFHLPRCHRQLLQALRLLPPRLQTLIARLVEQAASLRRTSCWLMQSPTPESGSWHKEKRHKLAQQMVLQSSASQIQLHLLQRLSQSVARFRRTIMTSQEIPRMVLRLLLLTTTMEILTRLLCVTFLVNGSSLAVRPSR